MVSANEPENTGAASTQEDSMSDLNLSIPMGNYDRMLSLLNRSVTIDGLKPVFMLLPSTELLFRAFRHELTGPAQHSGRTASMAMEALCEVVPHGLV